MTIQSVQRAVAILRSFSEIRPELGVTELATIHQVHKSTISRILTTLEEDGLVSQNKDTGKYRLGIGLVGLAGVALGQISVRGAAQTVMARLAHTAQETSVLMVRDGREAVTVEWFATTQALRYVAWIGRRVPLHCTAAGRILLAWLSPGQRDGVLPRTLRQYTESTITDRGRLGAVLNHIQASGWAIVREEFEEGFSSLGAPIRNHRGDVAAALTLAVPSARLTDENLPALREGLLAAAGQVSQNLGFGG